MKKIKILALIISCVTIATSFVGCSTTTSDNNGTNTQAAASDNNGIDTTTAKEVETEQQVEELANYDITYQNARTYTNSIGTVWLQTIIEVTNTGTTDLFLSSGAYDLEDSSGKLLASRNNMSVYPQVIAPGETAFYYEETTADFAETNNITVIPHLDINKATVPNIKYNVTDTDLKYNETTGRMNMLGRIENQTQEDASMVYIACVLYDEVKNPIGLMFTIKTDDVVAGDKVGFEMAEFSLPDDVANNCKFFDTFAFPFQFQFNF